MRLVGLFSVIAAVPTVAGGDLRLGAVPERARILVLRPRSRDARERLGDCPERLCREVERVGSETQAMSSDVAGYLRQIPIDDPRFADAFARIQVYQRGLSEAIIFTYGPTSRSARFALVQPVRSAAEKAIPPDKIAELANRQVVAVNSADRIGALPS
jgi:hypothetical protein